MEHLDAYFCDLEAEHGRQYAAGIRELTEANPTTEAKLLKRAKRIHKRIQAIHRIAEEAGIKAPEPPPNRT